MAESTQALAEQVFYMMCRFYRNDASFAGVKGGDLQWAEWKALDDNDKDYNIILDPNSLRPISMSALRSLVIELLAKGQMPLRFALETLEFPNADEIAEEQQKQLELAAVSRVKRPR